MPIDGQAPVGLFGRFRSITLELGAPLSGRRVLAQDLAADHAHDITGMVAKGRTAITLSGDLIASLATTDSTHRDHSDPGIVLTIGKHAAAV